jgi:type IV fimbrial biogenesis protein FimT
MKRLPRGFTLLELMITIALVAIVLGLGVPSFIDFMRNSRLAGTANDLLADLNLARTEAIKRHVPVTLCASGDPLAASPACAATDSTSFSGWIVFVDDPNAAVSTSDDGNAVVDTGETVLRRHATLPTGTTGKSDTAFITYADSGFPLKVGGVSSVTRVVFCDVRGNTKTVAGNSAARGVQILPTGRPGVTRSLSDITTMGGC